MKKKLTIIFTSLIIILMLGICFSNISNAAIEVKPGTTPHTNITASTSYQYCYDMRSSTSTLGNNSLDPHLTLNADWAATAYLGASVYGNVRSSTGYSVTIGKTAYNSTTNNITGVMNMGNKVTQTASLYELHSTNQNYINLVNNENTKYVEKLPVSYTIESTKGLGLKEVYGWWSSSGSNVGSSNPVQMRQNIFGYLNNTGIANLSYAYRPVIWN